VIRDPKKVPGLLEGGRSKEKINFINKHKHIYRINIMCEVLEISKSNYYKYKTLKIVITLIIK